jgi:hypothetical protein
MKTLITAAVLAAVAASPAFARTQTRAHVAPMNPQMSAPYAAPGQVYQGNQYIGADPDGRIRLELQRDTAVNGAA